MIRTTETCFVEPVTIYRVQVEWDTSDLGFLYEPIRRDTMKFLVYFSSKEEALEALKSPVLDDMGAHSFDWITYRKDWYTGPKTNLESNYYISQKYMLTSRSRARKAMQELYKTIRKGDLK